MFNLETRPVERCSEIELKSWSKSARLSVEVFAISPGFQGQTQDADDIGGDFPRLLAFVLFEFNGKTKMVIYYFVFYLFLREALFGLEMEHIWDGKIDSLSFHGPRRWIVFKLNFLVVIQLAWNDAGALELGVVEFRKNVKSNRDRVIRLVCDRCGSLDGISCSEWHLSEADDWRRNSYRNILYRCCYCDFDWIKVANIYKNAVLKKDHKNQ